jgi:hypothetical protein
MLSEGYSFKVRKIEISYYEPKNLFLSFNGLFCPFSHKERLISFAGAAGFAGGFFYSINRAWGKVTQGAVTSRRTDGKGDSMPVKFPCWTKHYPGESQPDAPSALMLIGRVGCFFISLGVGVKKHLF